MQDLRGHIIATFFVSILVFVELALDVKLRLAIFIPCSMFQSLFSWNLLLMIIDASASSRPI